LTDFAAVAEIDLVGEGVLVFEGRGSKIDQPHPISVLQQLASGGEPDAG
jgi:hypothetical protein